MKGFFNFFLTWQVVASRIVGQNGLHICAPCFDGNHFFEGMVAAGSCLRIVGVVFSTLVIRLPSENLCTKFQSLPSFDSPPVLPSTTHASLSTIPSTFFIAHF